MISNLDNATPKIIQIIFNNLQAFLGNNNIFFINNIFYSVLLNNKCYILFFLNLLVFKTLGSILICFKLHILLIKLLISCLFMFDVLTSNNKPKADNIIAASWIVNFNFILKSN